MTENDKPKSAFKVTTGLGTTMYKDGKLFKVLKFSKTSEVFIEVNPAEYDKRIHDLSKKIASYPGVDLLDVLRDALYDLPLARLEVIENMLSGEAEKPEPQVKTTKRDRGTCINVAIGGKFAFELRE